MRIERIGRATALSLVGGLLAAAQPVAADVDAAWAAPDVWTFEVTHVPDLDQKRFLVPNAGNAYCVPTSAMNWMAYFAEHGIPSMAPGVANWRDHALHGTMTNHLIDLGDLMGTHELNGTNGNGAMAGLNAWLPNGLFVVGHWYTSSNGSPRLQNMAESVLNGAYVMAVVGWYTDGSGNTITRGGGHSLSLNGASRSGPSMELSWRDPAADGGDYIFQQSPYATEEYAIQTEWLNPTGVGGGSRFMDRVVGFGSGILDEYFAIYPQLALTSVPDIDFQAAVDFAFQPDGSGVSELVQFDFDSSIVDITIDPEALGHIVITEDGGIWEISPRDPAPPPVVAEVSDARRAIVGRFGDLYVIDGEELVCLRPIDDSYVEIVRVTPPGPPDALAYDAVNDEVVVLSSVEHVVMTYPWHLDAIPVLQFLPGSVEFGAMSWLSSHPTTGNTWISTMGSEIIYHLLPGGILPCVHPTLVDPQQVDFNDGGHLFASDAGLIKEFRIGSDGELVPESNPVFGDDAAAGPFLCVARSATNHEAGVHDTPAWDHVLPEEQFGTPNYDCRADITGDGTVNVDDMLALFANWGTDDPYADISPETGDGIVNVNDMLALFAAWGPCPE